MKRLSILCAVVGLVLVLVPRGGDEAPPATSSAFEATQATEEPERDHMHEDPGYLPAPAPTAVVVVTVPPTTIPLALQTDQLQRSVPITAALPHDAARWTVDYRIAPNGALNLVVTLKVVLNRAEQLPQAQVEMRQYKAEALEWLLEHGVRQGQYPIEWRPTQAAPL